MSPDRVETEVDGRRLTLSNLEKVLYPEAGFTKGEIIRYYAEIAEVMLPHIQQRPMTLKRYPSGVDGKFFYEKHAPAHGRIGSGRRRFPTATRAVHETKPKKRSTTCS